MPENENVFFSTLAQAAAWRRRATSRLVHAGWRRLQNAGAVTAARPGPYRFGAIGHGTRLAFPQGTVFGEPWIQLGDHCIIGEQVTLTAGMMPGLDLGPEPVLRLGNGVVLGRGSHVVASVPVVFGNDVYCGPYVYVTSDNHSYDDTAQPVGKQWPRTAPVEIGSGSWLGSGCVILPGARLGRNVVVAAGAVVRGEVPDFAVVAGAPARVVRRWEPESGWQPPLRTPAPVPIPEHVTPEQLVALAALDEQFGDRLGEVLSAAPAEPEPAPGLEPAPAQEAAPAPEPAPEPDHASAPAPGSASHRAGGPVGEPVAGALPGPPREEPKEALEDRG